MGAEAGLTAAARGRMMIGIRRALDQIRAAGGEHAETDHECVRIEAMRLLGIPFGWRFLRRNGRQSIVCLSCFMESHHPEDVKRLYCGRCHVFHPSHGGDEEGLTGGP